MKIQSLLTGGLLMATSTLLLVPDTLIHTDFGQNFRELGASKKITGSLPDGVREDSSWADLRIHYEPMADRLGSNLRWTRVHLSDFEKGRGQLKWDLPLINEPVAFRASVTVASNEGTPIEIMVRQAVPPYQSLWSTRIDTSMERRTHTFEFQLNSQSLPTAFFVVFPQSGQVDLFTLSLEQRSEEEIKAARAVAIEAEPDNLLPWSGFPLGLSGAWSTGRRDSLTSDIQFEADPMTDPNGTVPLRITPLGKEEWNLYSPPFTMADPSNLHVLSFLVRGQGEGRVRIRADGNALPLERTFEVGPDYTRVVVPFRPDEFARWHIIHWEGKEEMSISSLMINRGRVPIEFTRQSDATITLDGDFLQGQVFVEGIHEPKLRYHATSSRTPMTLRTRLTDLYGTQQMGKPVTIDSNSTTGERTLAELGFTLEYGSYRLEAALEYENEIISPFSEVVLHHVRKPRYWGRVAPESKFGNHIHLYEPHMNAAKAVGINWNRFHGGNGGVTYWSGVEPSKGEWRWHRERLQHYRDHGFALLGVWAHSPGWARVERPTSQGWLDNWWQPADYSLFGDYVERSATVYSGLIDAWQIWNEPWGEFWFKEWRDDLNGVDRWHRGDTPEEDFVELSKVAWERSRNVLPEDFPVLGVGATVGERGKDWMRDLLALDVERYANVISYHAYLGGELREGTDPDSVTHQRLRNRIFDPVDEDPEARAMPLWMTEGNWFPRNNKVDTGLYRHTIVGEADPLHLVRHNAVRVPLYHALLFADGTEKIFLYALNGGPSYFRDYAPGRIDWSSMVTPGGEIHPSATVYSAMAYFLEAASFYTTVEYDEQHIAFVFENHADAASGSLALIFGPNTLAFISERTDVDNLQLLDFLGNPADSRIEHEMLYLFAPELQPEELVEIL